MLLLQYPNCDTCRKAKQWLTARGITFGTRHIVDDPPTVEELRAWIALGGLSPRKLFNTSGVLYRELALKDKLECMTEDEQIALLATNGKLVKRPLLVGKNFVLVGFKESDWAKVLS